MPDDTLDELLDDPAKTDAVSTCYGVSDGGETVFDWQDVRDEMTTGQWGRLIESGVLADTEDGFELENPEAIRQRLFDTDDEAGTDQSQTTTRTDEQATLEFLTTIENFDGRLTTSTVKSTPTLIHSLGSDGGRAVFGVLSGAEPEEWQFAHSVDVPSVEHTTELSVGEVPPKAREDSHRPFVYIDPRQMEQLGVAEGDPVWVSGDDRTVCLAAESFPADMGLGVARMGRTSMRNADISFGGMVDLQAALPVSASRVELISSKTDWNLSPELRENLVEMPVVEDDYVPLPVDSTAEESGLSQTSAEALKKKLSPAPDFALDDEIFHLRVGEVKPACSSPSVAIISEETDIDITEVSSLDGDVSGVTEDGGVDGDDTSAERSTEAAEAGSRTGGTANDQQIEIDPDRIPTFTDPALPDVVTYSDLEIGAHLGTGGFAEVHEATVESADSPTLAIKRLTGQRTLTKQTIDRFVTEAETWAKFDEEAYVVAVVDWGKVPRPWIAMEYMDGGDLHARIGDSTEHVPVDEGLWISSVLAETFANVHHLGVRHLDIQPRNVLFRETPDSTWNVPKIGDWGLAKAQLDPQTDTVPLNPRYAAPEQFDDGCTLDHRTDIYQLGAVVYELMTGSAPTECGADGESIPDRTLPTPPSKLRDTLPQPVDDAVLTALEPDPDDRYDRAVYFRDALEDCMNIGL
jgi:molecular chaperone DnaK/serine/threonine-protein kinase